MVSRVMLNSCPHDFQTFLSAVLLTSPFPLHQQELHLPRQTEQICLLTNLPSLLHCCCMAIVLSSNLAGTKHLSAFSHICALACKSPFLTWDSSSYPEMQKKDSTKRKNNNKNKKNLQYTKFFLNTDLSYDAYNSRCAEKNEDKLGIKDLVATHMKAI